jgi:hypothetical protein
MLSLSKLAAGFLVGAIGVMIVSPAALAHEARKVGKIQMTVGWAIEPAYTGFRNEVQLFLKDASGKPITDVGDNDLKVEVISGGQKTAPSPLDPSFDPDTGIGTPGEYEKAIIPTRPGNFTFRFVGTLRGQHIDESFTSSEKTFSPVTDAADAEFPAKDPSVAELAGLVTRLQPRVEGASAAAAQDRSLAVIGIVLGAIGTIAGLWPRRR